MCGRYALFDSEQNIKSHFKINNLGVLKPRYNIAPSLSIPIILPTGMEYAHWGFTPDWLLERGEATGPINARIESINEKPMFQYAWKKQRCLIPFSGFFEWRDGPRKQPFFFRAPKDLAAFAGIYTKSQQGLSVAIVTQFATDKIKNIHERMPCVLHENKYDEYLSTKALKSEENMFDDLEKYQVYPVVASVGNVKHDSPELVLPIK